MQLKRHLTRQAVDVTIRKKKNKRVPVRTAPSMLVATNSIARSTIERIIVPIIPERIVVIILQRFSQHSLRERAPATRITARYTTAVPRSTHKNAGVRVIAAVILKNAVMTPRTRLTAIAITVQSPLQGLHDVDIIFHLPCYSMRKEAGR